jgi:hypothetical protein
VTLKPRLPRFETGLHHLFARHPNRPEFGSKIPIGAHRMSEVFADFIYFPEIRTGNDPFVSDVIFTDTYGDEPFDLSERGHSRPPLGSPLVSPARSAAGDQE